MPHPLPAPCTPATLASLCLTPAPEPVQVPLLLPRSFFPQVVAQPLPSLPSVSGQVATLPGELLWPLTKIGSSHPLIPSPALFYYHLTYIYIYFLSPQLGRKLHDIRDFCFIYIASPGPRTVPGHIVLSKYLSD